MEYLISLIIFFVVFLAIKLIFRIKIFDSWKQWLTATVVLLLIGIVWDSIAIIRGWWSFGSQHLIGITIGVMPVEEYLFILFIPFGVIVAYKLVLKLNKL